MVTHFPPQAIHVRYFYPTKSFEKYAPHMNSIWERLTSRRQNNPASTDLPIQGDRRGVQLYADFQDCLDEHKGGAFLGEDLMYRY